jgi:hypothetical protein
MKLNKKRLDELECLKYFIPDCFKNITINDNDIQNYFEYSEQGKHKDLTNDRKIDGFNALVQGKRWRGIHAHEIYEPAINEGMGYISFIDKSVPKAVIEWLKKEMFKGQDEKVIEYVYSEVI